MTKSFQGMTSSFCCRLIAQNYFREQSDNIRSVNLVTEAVNVLSTLYASVTVETIDIVNQIFDTLNEMTAGNQATRTEVVNCKIIDFVNVILRTGTYSDCDEQQVVWATLFTGQV